MKKKIILLGTLDTKGDQASYLKEIIEKRGHQPVVIDVGVLGEAQCEVTITKHQVAEAAGMTLDDIIAMGKKGQEIKSLGKMAEGVRKILKDLNDPEGLDGILAIGGSMGTALALDLMDVFPLRMPKIILSTVANSPAINPDFYINNVIMLPWIGGLWGINAIARTILDQAGAIITAAAEAYSKEPLTTKKIIGVTSMGMAACRYLYHLRPALEERDYEVAVFHATGMNPRLLEKAIADGTIDASLELMLGPELLREVIGSSFSPGPKKLEAAIERGIPVIASTNNMDIISWAVNDPIPEKFVDRIKIDRSSLLCMIGISQEEQLEAASLLVEKLNRTTGPTALIIPLKPPFGITKYGLEDPASPENIRREIKKKIKKEVEVVELECSADDVEFTNEVVRILDEMLN